MIAKKLLCCLMFVSFSLSFSLSLVVPTASLQAEEAEIKPLAVGATAPAIALPHHGKQWTWEELQGEKVTVVAFLGTECPLVKLYAGRLQKLAEQYADQGVKLVGINSNQHDSLTEINHFVKTNKLTFPMLKDTGNRVADAYGAERTPEVFVLDEQGKVRYHGRIDDQYTYGRQRPKVTRAHLAETIKQLVAGEPLTVTSTEPVGCHIGRLLEPDPTSDITYSNQISRILQKRCVSCHRPGEIAPFALTDYDEVVGWAEMIAEVVSEKRMPPWHANPKHGKFSNDASLSEEEKQAIFAWVDAGAPEGDPKQLPEPVEYPEGWRIGEPDLIVKMDDKPFHVPAEGEVRYQYFQVDPGFTEDKWIQAAECRPGNRAVVHHIIVAAIEPGRRRRSVNEHGTPASDWVTATAPGAQPLQLPKGMAKRIPAGSRLLFQMHYTPNGTAQDDLSSVGFIFADPKTVKKEVATRKAATRGFRIPPGADNHKVQSAHPFDKDSLILTMFPHMHLRGKSFRYTLIRPDKSREILLDVPGYDFNWQHGYRLEKPALAPAGSTLLCTAHFDNSEKNLANPDPTKSVIWGDQTWEEMMIGYFDMVLVDQDLTSSVKAVRRSDKFLASLKNKKFDAAPFAHAFANSLESQRTVESFGSKLRRFVAHLDRMDWSYVEDGELKIARVAQASGPSIASAPLALPKGSSALADYVEKGQLVVNQSLSGVRNMPLSQFYRSSVHIPYAYDGKQGIVSFWSRESNAFPPEVVKALQQVVSHTE